MADKALKALALKENRRFGALSFKRPGTADGGVYGGTIHQTNGVSIVELVKLMGARASVLRWRQASPVVCCSMHQPWQWDVLVVLGGGGDPADEERSIELTH